MYLCISGLVYFSSSDMGDVEWHGIVRRPPHRGVHVEGGGRAHQRHADALQRVGQQPHQAHQGGV